MDKKKTKKPNKQNKDEKSKKRRIILLATLIPLALAGTVTGIVLGVKDCKKNKGNVEIGPNVPEGVTVKSENIEKGKESSFELNLPEGKEIDDIEITIGNSTLTKEDGIRIEGGKIIIPADKMIDSKIIVKTITFKESTKEVVGLEINPSKSEWAIEETIKASDVTVKAKYTDGTTSSELTWGTDYSISKDSSLIADFSTTGYTFTAADLGKGSALFSITYLKKTTVTQTFNVIVTPKQSSQEEFLTKYQSFLDNFAALPTTIIETSFDKNGTIKGANATKGTVAYTTTPSVTAVGTFDDTSSTSYTMGGRTYNDLKTYLDSFSSDYSKTFIVTDDSITFKVTLKSDNNQYETITYNKDSFITKWVNTISSSQYDNTNLTNILYADSRYFTVNSDGEIYATELGKAVETTILVPEKLDGKTITGIGWQCFCLAKLSSIKFVNENNITMINEEGFSSCLNLKSFILPDSVTSIGPTSFSGCNSLETFTINSTSKLEIINSSAFYGCALLKGSILLPSTINFIDAWAFSGTNIESVTFANASKKWVQRNQTSVLDISNPTNNATNLKNCESGEGNWGSTGIEAVKTITSFTEHSEQQTSYGFTTNLSEKANVVTSINPTLKFNVTINSTSSLDGSFVFTYDETSCSVDITEDGPKTVELTIDLTDIFDAADTGADITVDVNYNLRSEFNDVTSTLYLKEKIEKGTTQITIKKGQSGCVSGETYDVYATIDGGSKTLIQNIGDVGLWEEGYEVTLTLPSAVTKSCVIDVVMHQE